MPLPLRNYQFIHSPSLCLTISSVERTVISGEGGMENCEQSEHQTQGRTRHVYRWLRHQVKWPLCVGLCDKLPLTENCSVPGLAISTPPVLWFLN